MIGDEALGLLSRVAAILDRLGVPYLVGGSVASALFGEPRGTREEFSRRRLEPLVPGEPERVWVKTPEDSVLRKLLWYRDGQGISDQQWRDVLGLLSMRAGRLDDSYLNRWAARLELAELLSRAREQSVR